MVHVVYIIVVFTELRGTRRFAINVTLGPRGGISLFASRQSRLPAAGVCVCVRGVDARLRTNEGKWDMKKSIIVAAWVPSFTRLNSIPFHLFLLLSSTVAVSSFSSVRGVVCEEFSK
jgi:hypothetical protein